ncbi:cob(I)yrinic acid a,c-diamide adenosyltransferase [Granulicella aggregans]|jgi:cob(I)alamin adenosyltransferase|uniref:cob(I)yrinic acid a,c-diamide adenosyltransferase n=1 Tax=Granulicella aggregans TaxID=474949 RepID=UPI0021E0B7C8|nr:cob(I)yrinic acid a,c-diamide adenosyltransferase [Granulicella aggregans]
MSIATKTGDAGSTALAGGTRVSKADDRVEAYGAVDELNSSLGFARSICTDLEIAGWTEEIQKTLFRVGGSLASDPEKRRGTPITLAEDATKLTELVYRIEATPGILADWSLPGAHRESAAYEIARTICRRAERASVRLMESGEEVDADVLAYLNRLSDLIWLFGRLIEVRAGVDARLRDDTKAGPNFSRAW